MTNKFPFPFKSVVLTLAAYYNHCSFTKSCQTLLRTIPLSLWWACFFISSVDSDVQPGLTTTTSSQILHGFHPHTFASLQVCRYCLLNMGCLDFQQSHSETGIGVHGEYSTWDRKLSVWIGHKSHLDHKKMEVRLNGSICSTLSILCLGWRRVWEEE